jgi:RNA polymerase sigma-70 factor (ECF subfamily)
VKDRTNNPGSGGAPGAPGTTSLGLLDGLRAQHAGAWRRLALLYGPLVYGWCRGRGVPPEDAEDVLQEVFLVVANRIGDFRHDRPGDSFRGWLWGITRNKLGDWLRRRANHETAVGGTDAHRRLQEEPAAPDTDGTTAYPEGGEPGDLYRRALDVIRPEFEERSWKAFWRVVVEGQCPADVARDLGITRNAVYIAKSRVLHRLREALGEHG